MPPPSRWATRSSPTSRRSSPRGRCSRRPTAPLPIRRGSRRTSYARPGADARLSISSAWRHRLAIGPDGDPFLIEQFRRLAATLHQAHQAQGLRSIMVTSATAGDGKTMTAINLALVLAESYRYRVLLIDADLRRPSIANVVELGGGSGLSEALRAATPQKLALAQLTPNLSLLPAGGPTMNSIEALVSPRMQQILEEATASFDWVILDAPPVGLTADARLLSQMAGGTLFVIRAGKSQCTDVQKAVDMVGRDQILGVVLNDVEATDTDSYYYVAGNTDDTR
ncbi:MAG: CpsD/CapB family tyrosine-protein kinase [Vicinamibacterales bacterium]